MNRRAVLRTGVTALAAGGVVGTASGAEPLRIELYGGSDAGGEYMIEVTDPDAAGDPETLEEDDGVESNGETAIITGELDPDDTDAYEFDGQVLEAYFAGNPHGSCGTVSCQVKNTGSPSVETRLDVCYDPSNPEVGYQFNTTGSDVTLLSNTEPGEDSTTGGRIGDGDGQDSYIVEGVVNAASTCTPGTIIGYKFSSV